MRLLVGDSGRLFSLSEISIMWFRTRMAPALARGLALRFKLVSTGLLLVLAGVDH